MEFYSYAVVFILVILFAMLLPMMSGIGSFKVSENAQKSSSKRPHRLQFKLKNDDTSSGVSSASRNKHYEVDSRTGLKRRVLDKYNDDPNSYDYDVDDLISEDELKEGKDQASSMKDYEKFV